MNDVKANEVARSFEAHSDSVKDLENYRDVRPVQSLPSVKLVAPTAGAEGLNAFPPVLLPVRSLPALHNYTRLFSALGPLLTREPNPDFELDTDATAELIASAYGRFDVPVAKSGERRWLRAVVITEEAGSQMPIWSSTLRAISKLLTARGSFRTIIHQKLAISKDSGTAILRNGVNGNLGIATQAKWHRDEIILVASDFVSEGWWNGSYAACLAAWREERHVALLHLLPKRLWEHTWTGSADLSVNGQVAGGSSVTLLSREVSRPVSRRRPVARTALPSPINILSLVPSDFAAWAQVVVAGPGRAPAISLRKRALSTPYATAVSRAANGVSAIRNRAEAFRARASPNARKLARCLAVTAPLTIPMMQWVQASFLPQADSGDLAEFFLGGLLELQADTGAANSEPVFDMNRDIRAVLLEGMLVADALNVIRVVGARLMNSDGFDLSELLAVGEGEILNENSEISTDIHAFAAVTREFLARSGRLPRRNALVGSFMTEQEVAAAIKESINEEARKQVLVLSTPEQQRWVSITERDNLVIVLDSYETRKSNTRIQRVLKADEALPIVISIGEGIAVFGLAHSLTRWEYSEQLFQTPEQLTETLTELLRRDSITNSAQSRSNLNQATVRSTKYDYALIISIGTSGKTPSSDFWVYDAQVFGSWLESKGGVDASHITYSLSNEERGWYTLTGQVARVLEGADPRQVDRLYVVLACATTNIDDKPYLVFDDGNDALNSRSLAEFERYLLEQCRRRGCREVVLIVDTVSVNESAIGAAFGDVGSASGNAAYDEQFFRLLRIPGGRSHESLIRRVFSGLEGAASENILGAITAESLSEYLLKWDDIESVTTNRANRMILAWPSHEVGAVNHSLADRFDLLMEPPLIDVYLENAVRIIVESPGGGNDYSELAGRLAAELGLGGPSPDADRLRNILSSNEPSGPEGPFIVSPFLYPSPVGTRWSDGSYGAFYASDNIETAMAEVAYHTTSFLKSTREPPRDIPMRAVFVRVNARLYDFRDPVFDEAFHDPSDYEMSQTIGKAIRDMGGDGVLYRSVRSSRGQQVALFKPRLDSTSRLSERFVLRWNGIDKAAWIALSDI